MSPEALLRQFNVLADAPNGVEKLRELILQLAVRGKLVPQDPSDEPANVLLKRIGAEKQRLFMAGKIGKPKSPELLADDEVPYQQPESWRWVRLSSIGAIVGGGTPKTEVSSYWSDGAGVPWLTPADLNGLQGKFASSGRRQITDRGLQNSSARLLPAGAVLFSSRAPIGYVAIAANPLATNQGFKSCVPYLDGLTDYIYRFLQAVAPEIDRKAPGTTFREVSGKIVGNVAVPLPPLAEQRRIVAKVDELMTLCDQLEARQQRRADARVRLNGSALHHLTAATDDAELAAHWERLRENFHLLYDTPESVAELRQAVLHLAVRGKLVPQDPSDEPASVLLERIASEKRRLFKNGRTSKPRPLPPVGEDEVPFAVPDGWAWVRLGSLTDPLRSLSYGVLVPGPDVEDGIPFVRVQDISGGTDAPRPNKSIDRVVEAKYTRTRLQGGEILIGVVGSIGAVGIVPEAWAGANIARALCRFAPAAGIDRDYIAIVLRSPLTQSYFLEVTRTLAQPTLNVSQLEVALLPLPPLAEQQRIVAQVGEMMALFDRLEARLTAAREKRTHVAASVVHHLTAA